MASYTATDPPIRDPVTNSGVASCVTCTRGEALQAIQEAEGYATDRVNRAKGDAARFEALYAAYRRAPDVTRQRMYLETLADILPEVQRTVVFDEDLKTLLPLLSLDTEGK